MSHPLLFSHLCDCLPLPEVFHLCPIISTSLVCTVCVLPALYVTSSVYWVSSCVSMSHLPVSLLAFVPRHTWVIMSHVNTRGPRYHFFSEGTSSLLMPEFPRVHSSESLTHHGPEQCLLSRINSIKWKWNSSISPWSWARKPTSGPPPESLGL